MAGKVEETVWNIAEPIVTGLGYELVDIEYNKRKDCGNELLLYIDKDGGITLDDCEAVSRALDEPLDIADPIEESYVLSVSSLGIDRPLKTDRDYEKAIGKDVEIKLYKKLNGLKEFVGKLKGYDDESVTISAENNDMVFEKKDIAIIRLYIDF